MNCAASILLVDDHPLLRKGLKQLIELEDELEVKAEACSGAEAIALATDFDYDLIVLDLNMQGMDGIETLRELRHRGVSSHIVMLTVSDSEEDVVNAITQGADGYLLKDMEPELILEQLKSAAQGTMVICDKLTHILAQALRKTEQAPSGMATLTGREQEILKQISLGLSNKQIARELTISDSTVKVHVKHILKKLGLRSRVEAAVWVINQCA